MTKKEIKLQIALGTYLPLKWEERNKLYAEGNKLYAEGDKLYAKGDKLCAEGDKLHAEGDKLHAEGDLLYVNAVIEVYGLKAIIHWDTGEVE